MKAIGYDAFGEPAEVLRVEEVPLADPGDGEVRVRVTASPIHNHDLSTIRGVYGVRPSLPARAGTECCGVVDALGNGVTQLQVGTRVVTMAPGAWSEYVVVNAAAATPVPDTIDDGTASQLLAMPMSAVVLFDELDARDGAWIAQNAANGAVGKLVERIAARRGVRVLNLVRTQAAFDELHAAGARVVVRTTDGWRERALEATGGELVSRIVDSVGGAETLELMKLLEPRGELIVFGGLSGSAMRLDPSAMIGNEWRVRGFWMSTWMSRATPEERANAARAVFDLAAAGDLLLPVAARYPLTAITDAVVAAQTPGRQGKIVLEPARS